MSSPVFAEKYRPTKIADCILPEYIKAQAAGYVKSGRVPTLIMTGGPGCGKTTLARAIASEVGADVLFINASMESGIDTIRTKISQFASTVSFSNSKKITILDEADGLSQDAQKSLRGFIEEFSGNHSIIFTCNFISKLIDPLKSRSGVIDFKINKADRQTLATEFFKRLLGILDKEGIEYEKKAVAELVQKTFPDFRRCLNEIQRYAAGGKIDLGILLDLSEEAFSELTTILKEKKFDSMRKWVANHSDLDSATFFRMFYEKLNEKVQPKSIPALVLLIGEYSFRSVHVVDQEINTAAFLTEVLLSQDVVFK